MRHSPFLISNNSSRSSDFVRVVVGLVLVVLLAACETPDERTAQFQKQANQAMSSDSLLWSLHTLQPLQKISSTQAQADYNIGTLWLQSDSIQNALTHLQRAVTWASTDTLLGRAAFNLSHAQWGQDSLPAAIRSLKLLLLESPYDSAAAYNLAMLQRVLFSQQLQQPQQQSSNMQQQDENGEKQQQEQPQEQLQEGEDDASQQKGDDDRSQDSEASDSDSQSGSQQDAKQSESQSTSAKAINRQEAERLLEIMSNEEKETMRKMQRRTQPKQPSRQDW